MIAALVNAGVHARTSRPGSQIAARAFLFVDAKMGRGDRLGHSWRDGRLLFPGLASDHAAMIRAALALHEATGGGRLSRARAAWQAALDRHYADPRTGGYFLTANDAEGLVVRPNSTADEAIPNPNAVAAQNLVRLALLSAARTPGGRRPTNCSTGCCRSPTKISSCMSPAQRARSAPARRRDRGGRLGRRRPTSWLRPPSSRRSSTAPCCAHPRPRSLPACIRRRTRSRPRRAPRLSSASERPARCR